MYKHVYLYVCVKENKHLIAAHRQSVTYLGIKNQLNVKFMNTEHKVFSKICCVCSNKHTYHHIYIYMTLA